MILVHLYYLYSTVDILISALKMTGYKISIEKKIKIKIVSDSIIQELGN